MFPLDVTSLVADQLSRAVRELLSDRQTANVVGYAMVGIGVAILGLAIASFWLDVPMVDSQTGRAFAFLLSGSVALTGTAFTTLPVHEWAASSVAQEDLDTRIGHLASTLRDANDLIRQIERDLDIGASRVSELRDEITRNEELAQLSQREIAAVEDALRRTTAGERTFNVVLALMFFVSGVVASVVITLVVD